MTASLKSFIRECLNDIEVDPNKASTNLWKRLKPSKKEVSPAALKELLEDESLGAVPVVKMHLLYV